MGRAQAVNGKTTGGLLVDDGTHARPGRRPFLEQDVKDELVGRRRDDRLRTVQGHRLDALLGLESREDGPS